MTTPMMKDIEPRILHLLGDRDYVPLNVPELLRRLRLLPQAQQELQRMLSALEQAGRIARIKGNRYILSREADLIAGRIRMVRSGRGFLQPDDPGLKEIAIPESATSTAIHEDRVLVQRDVVTAQSSEVNALRGYSAARNNLDLVLGRVLETHRVDIREAAAGKVKRR